MISVSIERQKVPLDIHPNGRFLMMKPAGATDDQSTVIFHKINIVLNGFEELKERVPTD